MNEKKSQRKINEKDISICVWFFLAIILLAIVKLPVMAAPANVIADTSLDVSWLTSGETNENIDMDLKTAWILVVVAIVLVIIAIENIK